VGHPRIAMESGLPGALGTTADSASIASVLGDRPQSSKRGFTIDEETLRRILREELQGSINKAIREEMRELYRSNPDAQALSKNEPANVGHTGMENERRNSKSSDEKKKWAFAIVPQEAKTEMDDDEFAPRQTVTGKLLNKMHLRGTVDWFYSLEEPEREGPLSKIVLSGSFNGFFTFIIVVNCVFTLFAVDHGIRNWDEDPPDWFQTVEIIFLVLYSIELVMKLIVHRLYFFVNEEMKWNVFDFTLVMFTIVDQALASSSFDLTFMRSLRILKMAKILRTFKLVKSLKELKIIMNALMGSVVSLFWSIAMMVFIFFVFGLVFVQGTTTYFKDQDENLDDDERVALQETFGSVSLAILSLYKATTGGDDWSNFYGPLVPTGDLNCGLFLFFISFTQIAFMNILTGVFVETAMKLAEPDMVEVVMERRKAEEMEKSELKHLASALDTDGSNLVSHAEFMMQMRKPNSPLRTYLEGLGLDKVAVQRFFAMLLESSKHKEVDLDTFVQGCMKMNKPATTLDLSSKFCIDCHGLLAYCAAWAEHGVDKVHARIPPDA
jgi:voltage-gated sodium channel